MFEYVNEIGRLSLNVCVDLSRNVWWLSARNIQHMSYVGFPPIVFTTLGVVQAFTISGRAWSMVVSAFGYCLFDA